MLLAVFERDYGTEYHITCTTCGRELAMYLVYVENGLIDPAKDFYSLCEKHKSQCDSERGH